jgi:DNA-binding GntR family transcriptional regulator
MTVSSQISDRILESVLAKKLAPGSRLGEKQLAVLFSCSRTLVREALIRLSARGIVEVSARRGWYLVEPSKKEAQEAFEARFVIETGLLRTARSIDERSLRRLRAHIEQQQSALKSSNIGLRSYLFGDFHVCLAEALGNSLLAETIRDLIVRTTLAAMLHQSDDDAARSCAEHAGIVAALEAGDLAEAEHRMANHLGAWEAKLPIPSKPDPLAQLRQALAPVEQSAHILRTRSALRKGRETPSLP